jgi:hypothetical protein
MQFLLYDMFRLCRGYHQVSIFTLTLNIFLLFSPTLANVYILEKRHMCYLYYWHIKIESLNFNIWLKLILILMVEDIYSTNVIYTHADFKILPIIWLKLILS